MLPLRYSVRSLLTRRGATISTAVGTAAVVFLLASSLMVSNGVQKTFALAGGNDTAVVLRLGSEGEGNSVLDLTSAAIALARGEIHHDANGGLLATAEVLVNAAIEKIGAPGVANVQIRGVEPTVSTLRPQVKTVAGRWMNPGAAEAVVGERIAGRFKGLAIGDTFELRKNRPVAIVGVFAAGGSSFESEVWVDRELVQSAYGRSGTVSSVRANVGTGYESFKAAIEQDRRLSCQVLRESEYYAKQSASTSAFISILGGAVSIFFAIAAILGGTTTMHSSVVRRRREIGIFRALGFSRASILVAFLVESIVLSVTGGLLGLAAALAMGSRRFSMMNFASWSEIVFRLEAKPSILAIAFGGAIVVGASAGLLPALRASRVSTATILKG
jgi:putative ABC transport system permease protein